MIFSILLGASAKTLYKSLFGYSAPMAGLWKWHGILPGSPGVTRIGRIIFGVEHPGFSTRDLFSKLRNPLLGKGAWEISENIDRTAVPSIGRLLTKEVKTGGFLEIEGLSAEHQNTLRRLFQDGKVSIDDVTSLSNAIDANSKLKLTGHSKLASKVVVNGSDLKSLTDYANATLKFRAKARTYRAYAGGIAVSIGVPYVIEETLRFSANRLEDIGNIATGYFQMISRFEVARGFQTTKSPQATAERGRLLSYLNQSRMQSFTGNYGTEAARLHR